MAKITPKADETLNLEGVPCPQNSARALLKLSSMEKDLILEIIVDDGEPRQNVPPSLEEAGYKIKSLVKGQKTWRIFVETL